MDQALPFPWNAFRQLQAVTDTKIVGARAHARDEALSELLEGLATGVVPSDGDAMQRRYWALVGNRAKKYRHRAALGDQVVYHEQLGHHGHDQFDLLALRELVALALAGVAPQDVELLHEVLSSGMPYREVASKLGRPVGTLKARACRLRRQIRGGRIGYMIQLALAAA